MHIRTTTAALLTATALAVTGCTSSSSGDDSKAPLPQGVASAVAKGNKVDGPAVVAQLAAAVPTVTLAVDYTAASDPNHRLGRAHQYLSKTSFTDSRVSADGAKDDDRPGAIVAGGTVEIFATAADAKKWVAGIDAVQQGLGALSAPDYLLREGRVVIRASNLLTPAQADEYRAVLTKLS